MTGAPRALRGRVVLVVGGGDRVARLAALQLAALGAAVVVAGPEMGEVVATAGLIAAAGGTVRVVERKAPPLEGAELLLQAAAVFEPVTDAIVAESAFETTGKAWEAAHAVSVAMPHGTRITVLPRVAAGEEKAAADRVASRFLSWLAPDAAPPSPADDDDDSADDAATA